MIKKTKIKPFGYFSYFYKYLGNHILLYILLNFLVGFLDGIGLAMFIPLLSTATGSSVNNDSIGDLQFIIEFSEKIGGNFNLSMALLIMIVLFSVKGILYYIRILYFTKIRLYMMRKVRLNLVQGLNIISYKQFTSLDPGRIQNNMVGETNRLLNAMTSYFNTTQHVVMLITYVFLAVLSNWKFAIMVAIGGLFTNFIYSYINKITKEYSRKQTSLNHNFNGNLIQAIQNFKYLKATNYLENFSKKLTKNISHSEGLAFKISKVSAIGESLREPMIIIIISFVIIIQVNVMHGSFSSILVSLLLFYRALAHLVSMQNAWNSFIGSSAGIESVEKMLEDFNYDSEFYKSEYKISNITNIHLSNVNLSMGSKDILKDISLILHSKSSIAFVGESGAGKTTLANIICGLQKPTSGIITIDNVNLFESDLNNYRKKIGYITQEPVIFNDTLFNNITFWAEKNDINFEKFMNTLKLVSLIDFYEELEDKEETQLGNNGLLISGGQKQRISIARELYKEVDLLILDEATSALDSETEKYIKDQIDLLQGKCSLIIIAHRLSTIKNVDKIYLLEKGEIISSGSFDELIENSDKFKKMVELQYL